MVRRKSKVTKLEEEIVELNNKWKRALADYQNLEKRAVQEKTEFVKFAGAALLDKLLPILDSLEKCQIHFKDKGLDLTLDQFKKTLESEG